MAVKIRLARRGRKKYARYDIVVADVRAPRDGKFIEKIGTYNPNTDPANIDLNTERAFEWVMKGVLLTDTVRAILSYKGVLFKKHIQLGVLKGALSQEEADKKIDEWLKEKESKIQQKIEKLEEIKTDNTKATLKAESKVKEKRAEALQKKLEESDSALVQEIKENNAESDEDVAEDVVEIEKKPDKPKE